MKKIDNRGKRRQRIRKKIFGTNAKPRTSVFRSNKHIYVQAIDDESGKTMVSFSDFKLGKSQQKKNRVKIALEVGKEFGKKLKAKKIKTIVFDRGGYRYHGRIKALAEGIRESGIKF